MSAPEYFKHGAEELKKDQKRVEEIEALLMDKLERCEGLEGESTIA